jgi:hypothetical protein
MNWLLALFAIAILALAIEIDTIIIRLDAQAEQIHASGCDIVALKAQLEQAQRIADEAREIVEALRFSNVVNRR